MSKYTRRLFFFFLIWNVDLILTEEEGEHNVLLLLKARSGISVIRTWYGLTDQDFVEGNKDSIFNVFPFQDNYRSRLIDDWNINPPEKIKISLLNAYKDRLFWITFNVAGSDYNPENWSHETRIIGSSLNFHSSDVYFDDSDFFEVIFKDNKTSLVWYAVFRPSFKNDPELYPRFFFTKSNDSPYALRTDLNSTLGHYEGCSTHALPDARTTMSPESCFRECKLLNFDLMLLGYPDGSCACGFENDLGPNYNNMCASCGGELLYLCGSVIGMYGVYEIKDTEWHENELDPRRRLRQGLLHTFSFNFNVNTTIVRLLDNNASDALFVTSVELSIPQANGTEFSILYGSSENNLQVIRKEDGSNEIFPSGTVCNISVIRAALFEVKVESIVALTFQNVTATMHLYGFLDNFIEAPWILAEGIWKEKETTSTQYPSATLISNAAANTSSSLPEETSQFLSSSLASEAADQGNIPMTTSVVSTENISIHSSAANSEPSGLFNTANVSETSDPRNIPFTNPTDSAEDSSVSSRVLNTEDSQFNTVELTSKTGTSTNITTTKSIAPTKPHKDPSISTTINSITSQETNIVSCSNCSCHVTFTFGVEISPEIQQRIESVKRNLTLSKKTLTSYLRSKMSASDDRTSSTCLGSLGVIVITFVITAIVSVDFINYITVMKAFFQTFRS